MGGCLETAAGHLSDQHIEPGLIAADDGDMRAEACEQPGDRAPDAPAPPDTTITRSFSASLAKTVGWTASSASVKPSFAGEGSSFMELGGPCLVR